MVITTYVICFLAFLVSISSSADCRGLGLCGHQRAEFRNLRMGQAMRHAAMAARPGKYSFKPCAFRRSHRCQGRSVSVSPQDAQGAVPVSAQPNCLAECPVLRGCIGDGFVSRIGMVTKLQFPKCGQNRHTLVCFQCA